MGMRVQHAQMARPEPERRAPPFADWKAIVVRAGKRFLDNNAMMLASALAYSTFFAIPSVLLVVVGLFTLIAGADTITTLMQHFNTFMPAQATSLLKGSLLRADAHPASSIALTIIGFVLAMWSVTGAMNAYMLALNIAYERKDRRSFLKKRVVALKMAVVIGIAFALVAVLTIFGLFAVYTATFASYNKTWGALSAVIVMLTWLWLTANALLLGAEINAEVER